MNRARAFNSVPNQKASPMRFNPGVCEHAAYDLHQIIRIRKHLGQSELSPDRMPFKTGAMSPGAPSNVSDSRAVRPPAAAARVVFTAILLASRMHPNMHPASSKKRLRQHG
jgi:hypothetical protein